MKNVLITGANSGIGLATARLFLKAGYFVLAHYHSSRAELDNLENENLVSFKSDFSKPEEVRELFDNCLSVNGRIDVLVNNAADYISYRSIDETDEKSFEKILRINLIAPFILSKLAYKSMIGHGGKIINISSVGVKYGGSPNAVPYSASKAALESMTRTFAKAGAKHNVLVNAVRAGVTDTSFHHKSSKDMKSRVEMIPLKRMAKPEEIAQTIMFLASDHCGYTTGSILDVTGGE